MGLPYRQLKENLNKCQEDFNSLSEKYNFVSEILATKSETKEILKNLNKLIEEDYREFAKEENSLADEAGAYAELLEIKNELTTLISFPKINSKTLVALSGEFSSGKSEFINSLLKSDNIKLPVDISPTTAIPTYVVDAESIAIKGYTYKEQLIDIDPEFFMKISHQFKNEFSFNLREILPSMLLETPFNTKFNLKHLCFLDTPGFEYEKTDDKTALESLNKADVIFWMVNVKNGELKESELNNLSKLTEYFNKKIYIVLTKADLEPESNLKETLKECIESLELKEIPYEGISVYSSRKKKEYLFEKVSLYDFLENINSISKKREKYLNKVDAIFSNYKKAIDYDIKKINDNLGKIHSFKLDLWERFGIEIDFDTDLKELLENTEEKNDIPENIKKLQKKIEKNLKQLEKQINNYSDMEQIKRTITECRNDIKNLINENYEEQNYYENLIKQIQKIESLFLKKYKYLRLSQNRKYWHLIDDITRTIKLIYKDIQKIGVIEIDAYNNTKKKNDNDIKDVIDLVKKRFISSILEEKKQLETLKKFKSTAIELNEKIKKEINNIFLYLNSQ